MQLCDWGMGVAVPGEEGDRELDVLLDIDLYGSLRDRQGHSGIPGAGTI